MTSWTNFCCRDVIGIALFPSLRRWSLEELLESVSSWSVSPHQSQRVAGSQLKMVINVATRATGNVPEDGRHL
ncbi:hypothetical protein Q8A67_023166 [Cirrhinus molitorella]|uniref:Uncharacterized protein n=1 Tax=Cirrhinus molitorella TaxID=172907 RepID=A0AA88TKN8_9TELE|nr:hypothetical protein Q8A67_023166 [Cirrhinus molitorella]